MLEDGPKASKGVNCQRKQDHVLVKDVANDCVADGGDASCWVGFVVASELLFFLCGTHPDALIPRKCRDDVKLDCTKKTCEARLQEKRTALGSRKICSELSLTYMGRLSKLLYTL